MLLVFLPDDENNSLLKQGGELLFMGIKMYGGLMRAAHNGTHFPHSHLPARVSG